MNKKLKSKLGKNSKNTKQDKNLNNVNQKLIVNKLYYKRNNYTSKKKAKPKVADITLAENKLKLKYNPININIEDSSTNYFSGNNIKFNSHDFDFKLNDKKIENIIIPALISKESEHESLFINFKLGEKDSLTESTVRSDLITCNNDNKIKNLKQNKNDYNRCEVDENLEQNENNSFEIYDFNDKTNVDFVLRNLSALSCSKSGKEKSSFLFNDCNDEFDENFGNKQKINKIKIFNVKQSIPTNCSKNKNQLRLSSKY